MSAETYDLAAGLPVIKRRIEEAMRRVSRPFIAGIAGSSGSGKTTLAEKNKDCFLGSIILNMDDYFKGREFMKSIGSDNFDDPVVTDLDLLSDHLRLLKSGLPIHRPVYSFKTGLRNGYVRFEPADLIILEGLFTLREPVINEVDFKIFVEASVRGSLIRRLIRDTSGRTNATEQGVLRRYVETVYPMYKLHIEPTKSVADIVIINEYNQDIEPKLSKRQEIQINSCLEKLFGKGI